jgi:hypothetical protein
MRNRLAGRYLGAGLVATPAGDLAGQPLGDLTPGAAVAVVIAPDAAEPAGGPGPNTLAGELRAVSFRGRAYRVSLELATGQQLDLDLAERPAPGALTLRLSQARVLIYPAEPASHRRAPHDAML